MEEPRAEYLKRTEALHTKYNKKVSELDRMVIRLRKLEAQKSTKKQLRAIKTVEKNIEKLEQAMDEKIERMKLLHDLIDEMSEVETNWKIAADKVEALEGIRNSSKESFDKHKYEQEMLELEYKFTFLMGSYHTNV